MMRLALPCLLLLTACSSGSDGGETPAPDRWTCSVADGEPCGDEGTCLASRCYGELISIPASAFRMGSPDGEGVGYERPAHDVTVGAFQLEAHEVTRAQYARFLQATGGKCTDDGTDRDCFFSCLLSGLDCNAGHTVSPDCGRDSCDALPVVAVTWWGARSYCAWAGRRLPTDTEWERAANGPAGADGRSWRRFPWSAPCTLPDGPAWDWTVCPEEPGCPARFNAMPDQAIDEEDPILQACTGVGDARANCAEADCNDGFVGPAPVGSFPAGDSVEGVTDLAGNVWEWTEDCWHDDLSDNFYGFVGAPTDGSAWTVDCGYHTDAGEPWRARRGGSYDSRGRQTRTRTRSDASPEGGGDLGFRCAKNP